MKSIRTIGAVALVAAGLGFVTAPAMATKGHDKPAVCHPVEGAGETGYGWNIISPDQASHHMDEHGTPDDLSDDTGLHTRKDGRTDVYAVDGLCPGSPEPTDTETTSTATETSTATKTETTGTTTSTSTSTATETETTGTSTVTGSPSTTTAPQHTKTATQPVTTHPATRVKHKPAAARRTPVSVTTSAAPELAYTGSSTLPLTAVGIALVLAGLALMKASVSVSRKH